MKRCANKGKNKRTYFEKGEEAKRKALNDIAKECGDGKLYNKSFIASESRYNYFLKNMNQILDLLPYIKITTI